MQTLGHFAEGGQPLQCAQQKHPERIQTVTHCAGYRHYRPYNESEQAWATDSYITSISSCSRIIIFLNDILFLIKGCEVDLKPA